MITCPQCGMTSHNPNDERERYCGNCHQFHDEMREKKMKGSHGNQISPGTGEQRWIIQVVDCFRRKPLPATPEEMAERIHEAFVIAEIEKYAVKESRFELVFDNASEEDIAAIRRNLSEFENSILKLSAR